MIIFSIIQFIYPGNLVGSKSSNTGQLERELDRVRSYRDTLVSGELSWKDATLFAQDSADYSRMAYNSWQSLETEE
jgi:hypothetical protein